MVTPGSLSDCCAGHEACRARFRIRTDAQGPCTCARRMQRRPITSQSTRNRSHDNLSQVGDPIFLLYRGQHTRDVHVSCDQKGDQGSIPESLPTHLERSRNALRMCYAGCHTSGAGASVKVACIDCVKPYDCEKCSADFCIEGYRPSQSNNVFLKVAICKDLGP